MTVPHFFVACKVWQRFRPAAVILNMYFGAFAMGMQLMDLTTDYLRLPEHDGVFNSNGTYNIEYERERGWKPWPNESEENFGNRVNGPELNPNTNSTYFNEIKPEYLKKDKNGAPIPPTAEELEYLYGKDWKNHLNEPIPEQKLKNLSEYGDKYSSGEYGDKNSIGSKMPTKDFSKIKNAKFLNEKNEQVDFVQSARKRTLLKVEVENADSARAKTNDSNTEKKNDSTDSKESSSRTGPRMNPPPDFGFKDPMSHNRNSENSNDDNDDHHHKFFDREKLRPRPIFFWQKYFGLTKDILMRSVLFFQATVVSSKLLTAAKKSDFDIDALPEYITWLVHISGFCFFIGNFMIFRIPSWSEQNGDLPRWGGWIFFLHYLLAYALIFNKWRIMILIGVGWAFVFWRISGLVSWALELIGMPELLQTLGGLLTIALFGTFCVNLATKISNQRTGTAGARAKLRKLLNIQPGQTDVALREGLVEAEEGGMRGMQ